MAVINEARRRSYAGAIPWAEFACCKGRSTLFFSRQGERPERRARRETEAKALCEACPVLEQCRSWARRHREYGFWGGETQEERAAAGYRPTISGCSAA